MNLRPGPVRGSDPPMGDLKGQASAWDDWLMKARVGQTTARDEHTDARAQAVCAELAKLPRGGTILDVGCGDGFDSALFARYGTVTATDLAPATIQDAQARYPGVTFLAGDFLSMSFPGAPYDALVSLETLSHVDPQSGFIHRCAELLKPGGTCIITTQNRLVYDHNDHPAPNGYLRRWLTPSEVRDLMAPHFAQVRVSTFYPVPPGTLKGKGAPLGLRLSSSYKVNRLLGPLRGMADRVKCAAGLGMTILAVGTKR